jgi:hypothetical protein
LQLTKPIINRGRLQEDERNAESGEKKDEGKRNPFSYYINKLKAKRESSDISLPSHFSPVKIWQGKVFDGVGLVGIERKLREREIIGLKRFYTKPLRSASFSKP